MGYYKCILFISPRGPGPEIGEQHAEYSFLCLETKKRTKTCLPVGRENSRKKVMLRTFFHCSRTSSRTTDYGLFRYSYFLFRCNLTSPN